jgi:hypothetical protein
VATPGNFYLKYKPPAMMNDTTTFPISYVHDGKLNHAQIQPCCREDNIVDYAVYQDSKLAFTIAHDMNSDGRWIIAMKNADNDIPDDIVQAIGSAIDKKQIVK